jgi:PAS domain S-box-containing protein
MRTALSTGSADDNRWQVRKDGSKVWVWGQLMPLLDDAQTITGFVKIMRDCTKTLEEDEALRASQERLQLILKSAIDYAIITFDGDGSIMTWNAGAQRIFGYSEEEISRQSAGILFTPQEREEGALEWEMETAMHEGRAENERFHIRKDGSTFWGSGLTMPLRAQQGKPGYLKVMRDDTDRHFAEQQQQMLVQEMNHRVKNSLLLVTGMLSMQARAADSIEVKRALTDAETRIATIAQVHDHLWRQPHVENVDLADFLTQLCDRLKKTSEPHHLAVECRSCAIDTDRAIQVALLVNELVTNAFKHAYPEGTGDVFVNVSPGEGQIHLIVADHGVGLPEDFQAGHFSGRSLGVKIINGLVQQLRARLVVETNSPGARFSLTIPVERATDIQ